MMNPERECGGVNNSVVSNSSAGDSGGSVVSESSA